MNTLYKILLVLNYLAYVFIDICAWGRGMKYGLIFLLPLVIFPVTLLIADKVIISRADEFFLSEWSVFKKKVGWGNSVVVVIIIVLLQITPTSWQRISNGRGVEMKQEYLQTTNIKKDEAKGVELKKVIRNSGQQDDRKSEAKQNSFKQVYFNEVKEEMKKEEMKKEEIQEPVVSNGKTEAEIRKEIKKTKKQEAIDKRKSRKEARQAKKRQRKEEK